MADFTWDDIEDAATEKTETSSDAEKPEPQEAKGDFTWDDVEDTLVASVSTPERPNSPAARRWEDGDGESATVPEGYVNHWGGNLRVGGRKPYIRRDEQGKVAGYSSGESAVTVRGEDGKFAIVPLVADGKALSIDEAIERYKKTGEHWGRADSEEGARKILDEVGMANKARDQKDWIEYVQAHWDEMGDEFKNDLAERAKKAEEERAKHKVERGKDEIMDLEWQAMTGQRGGAGRYVFSGVAPFVGGGFEQDQKDKVTRMYDFARGKPHLQGRVVDGRTLTPEQAALGRTMSASADKRDALDDMLGSEAEYLLGEKPGSLRRGEGESRKDYESRLKGLVDARLKDTVAAQMEAMEKLDQTSKTLTDTIVVDGLSSLRYLGEMAAGGMVLKGAEGAKLSFDMLTRAGLKKLITKEGAKEFAKLAGKKVMMDAAKAAPATAAGTMQGSREFARDELGLDAFGDVVVVSPGDKGGTLGKAFRNSFTENLLENLVGEVTRPVMGKVVSKLAAKGGRVGKAVKGLYDAYNQFTDVTGFGDVLFEELPEENVQYFFSDVLGWGKKDSEFKGVFEEFANAFGVKKVADPETGATSWQGNPITGEGQYTVSGQWNTALAMILQMGLGVAMAGGSVAKARFDEKRDLGDQLVEKAGLTKAQVAKMSLSQRTAFANLWNKLQDDPEALASALEKAGGYIGRMATDLARQTAGATAKRIQAMGATPHVFEVQTEGGAFGKPRPKFSKAIRLDDASGKSVVVNEMHDAKAGVTIAENPDGSFEVRDEIHPARVFSTASFEEAKRCADLYALTNQKQSLENDQKRQVAMGLVNDGKAHPAELVDHVGDVNTLLMDSKSEDGKVNFHGITDPRQLFQTGKDGSLQYPFALRGAGNPGGIALPDGTVLVILDNVRSPEDLANILAPEEPEGGSAEGGASFSGGVHFQNIEAEDETGEKTVTRAAVDVNTRATIIDNGDGSFTWFNPTAGTYGEATSVEDAVAKVNAVKPTATPKQETPNEAGNGTDEAPARPEQGAAGKPQAPEVARPAEGEPPRAETPRAGVVEKYTPEKGRDDIKVQGTDYTVGQAKKLLREDVEAKIADAAEELGVDLKVVDIELHGSRVRGDSKADSDLDLVVEYSGDAREDTLFEILNENPTDFYGIKVDINPINAEKTGTLAEYMKRSAEYDAQKRAQATAKPAGARPATETSETTPKAEKPAEPASDATTQKPAASSSPAVTPEPAPKTTTAAKTTEPAKPDTADLEKMIAAADPDLESARSMDDENAFRKALDGKNLSQEERNKLLDRFYETHPAAARRARVAAKKTLRNKLADKASKDFAQHILDKYAPDGQTVKAKRDASRAATMEKANAVPAPGFLGKKTGTAQGLVDYLADKAHNRASLHKAIQSVRDHVKKFGSLGFSKADKAKVSAAIDAAQKRLGKMTEEFRKGFGEQGADIPKDKLAQYLERANKENSLLGFWLEKGRLLVRPRSAKAAKDAVGAKNALVNQKFDGKLFDPDAEGADALNSFFDGMKGQERAKWLRILFGRNTSEVTTRSDGSDSNDEVVAEINNWVRGDYGNENDGAAERYSLGDIGRILADFAAEVEEFQEWLETNETAEERAQREQYEYEQQEEQKVLDAQFGPIDDYRIAELEARGMADLQYANAKAFVENRANERDVAMLTPSALAKAEEGDKIRLDHHRQTFDFLSYDAENGILYVEDRVEVQTDEGEYLAPRTVRFRVTEDGISEIKEETNDTGTETGTPGNLAPDEKGAATGGSREEGENGEGGGGALGPAVASAKGGIQENRGDAAGAVSPEAEQYRTVAAATNRAWQEAHPDEVAKLLENGIDASAVAANPNVKGGTTDAVSWPITATRIGSREDAANLFRVLSNPDYEISKVLYLDEDGNILDSRVTHIGVIGETNANIADIVANAPKGTYGVVFSHNHPAQQGAKIESTKYDDATTRDLKAAVEKAGLKLLDHIITDHNAYQSYGGTEYVSDGAEEFWNRAQALGDFFGESVEKPADAMNLVPYGERIDLSENGAAKLNALAALASKAHDKSSWIVGIDDSGKITFVAAFPKGGDAKTFLSQHHGARRFAVLNGENAVDMPAFVKALGKSQAVIAVGENGKIADFKDSTDKNPAGLNDKILASASPAAPTAPRLGNAPKLDGDAQKDGLDILGELGGLLKTNIIGLEGAYNVGLEDGLDKAGRMEDLGFPREDIWAETGWWRGKDGFWRIEMPNIEVSNSFINWIKLHANEYPSQQLKDVVPQKGNEWLYESYPKIASMPVVFEDLGEIGGEEMLGVYRGMSRGFSIGRALLRNDPGIIPSVLTHELQHYIQDEEGFARGASPKEFEHSFVSRESLENELIELESQMKDLRRESEEAARKGIDANRYFQREIKGGERRIAEIERTLLGMGDRGLTRVVQYNGNNYADDLAAYRAVVGEVEARNVQKRREMTPEERAAHPPWETEDVPASHQIDLEGSGGDRIAVSRRAGTEDGVLHSPVTPLDGESRRVLAEFKDPSKYIETYRAMLLRPDGKLAAVMATKTAEPMELGKVYKAEERPELRGKGGKFPLKSDLRASGRNGSVGATYAPYFHSGPGVINDQFSVAYDKPSMVTVVSRVLKSDLASGYQAEGSPRKTGLTRWETSGPVARQTSGRAGRDVYLSRYIMPVRVLSDAETARLYKEELGGADVVVPWNRVPPGLRGELQKIGVKVGTEAEFRDGALRAPVAPLDREQFEKLRAVAIKLMDHLAAHGYNTFDDMVRYVAANRPDLYERLKDPLRRAWNSSPRVVDEADEITIARGRQIFGKIDTELQEASHDSARNGQDRAEGRGGERDQAPGDNAVAGGAGVGDGGPQAVRVPGRGRPVADNVDGQGPDVGDAGVDGEGQGAGAGRGVGGDADRQRAGVGPGAVSDGDAQRDSEGPVQELNEVTPGFSEYEPPADLPVKAPKSQSLIVESSALASITPPKIETKPDIPDSIPENGVLQAHQYHTVCQVVNAHNAKLPNGQRRGYLCGDGTGAGKTRIIAGVMLDAVNRNLGNGKALIISKDGDLLDGAKSDFKPFGIADKLFELDAKGRKQMAQGAKGIAFTTYASLAQNFHGIDAEGRVMSAGKRGKTDNRFAEIVKWLGKDFDGVIALDEAHSAAKGDLANLRAQATRAQAVIDLQNALPNARVLYLTATAAYDANHLKFLTRLGLWGEGTGFGSLVDFANAVNQGGLSMMEILTQGLKAKGLYCSRSISFKGVKCNRVVARLTPELKETYSRYSNVLSRIHDAALQVGEIVGVDAKQQARQYFGRMLDLFNSLITSMKVQKAIELGRAAIAEGKSPVFQLISTNESARDAKSAKQPKKQVFDLFGNVIGEEQSDEVEVGVKDRIIAYLNGGGFPVRENLGKVNGVQQWGEEIPEAVALRDEMVSLVESLPNVANPIDELTKAFADVGISRITGKSDKNAEANKFNNGDNLALVFSGAGGTGASYHADKRFKNQRQRVQIPIEFGWEPEKFLQALGRSHRNNQVVPPEFVLLTTDIAGEMRFMSTIANRVASMGAIVGGDRNSSGQVVSAADSVDTIYGRAAIRDAIRKLASGQRIGEMPGQEVFAAMFLNPDKADEIEPTKFLGRMQFLPVDEQSAIYSEIADRIERAVAKAKADGTYDDGIRKITAKRVEVKDALDVSARNTGASLLTVGETYDSTRIDHNALEARAPEGVTVEYMRNKRSGRLYALLPNGQNFVRLAPDGSYETVMPLERGNYERVGADAARKEWDEEYAKLPAEVERVRHYMSGDLIPLWDVIGVEGRPFVYRAQPQGAKPFIGLYISDAQMPVTLFGFGLKEKARKLFAESAYRLVAREGARLGIGAAGDPDVNQPYFKKMKIGTRYVLAVVHAEGSPVAADLTGNGWDKAWAKDETNSYDRGGDVYYRDFDDAAEAAMKEIFKKHGAVVYHGSKAVFESKDGLVAQAPAAPSPERGDTRRPVRGGPTARPMPNPSGATLGERVGMPEMRMRLENGLVYITNTKPVKALLNNMKLAFGGEWANRVRDGKRYVKSNLKWNPDPSGRGGFWSIPLDKVPPEIRSEIEGSGELRSTVVPIGSADELEREGGLVRLAQNPVELKTTFVHNMLRAGITPLEDTRLVAISDAELVRRAADEGDMTALGELYKRYMGENAKNGGLRGLIRRAAARKGMTGVLTADRIEEVASLVWAGVASDGAHYEQRRNGVVADFASGNVEIYRNAKSLIPAMSAKIDQVLNDMAERSKKRPELLTLDKPSRAREGESELDQQMADNPSVADATVGGEIADETAAAGEIAVDDGTPEGALARKVGGFANMLGRRLTPEERSRLNAMDVLEETMFFLPDELQDVINAVLAEERKRGFTDKGAKRITPESMSAARQASGLSPRVFGYRYRTAKELLNEIWNNIKSGKADENIAIKAREIEGLGETDEEINEDILDNLDISADTRRVLQLLLDGEAVSDIAEAFKLSPALVRAWKARARNEYGLTFPADANENSLGLDLGEPDKTERKSRAPRAKREASGVKIWTPDLFAAASATVGDVQAEKISAGIAAGASDEQIAREADVAPEIVKLARIREKDVDESPVVAPGAAGAGTRYVREENRFNNETGHFEKVRVAVKTDGTTEVLGPAAKPQGEASQGTLFAPVTPLEQGTLGIESVAAEPPLGYANAAVNEWRSEHGYSEIAKKAKVSLDDLNRLGAAMANNVREMERMVERLSRAPYAVSPVEQVALGQYIVAQERKFNALHVQKQEAFANGNEALAASIDLEAQEVFTKLDAAQRINNRVVGNQLGLAMRARQLTLNEDGSIADYMISCARANGGPLTKAQREQAEKLFAQLAKANVELDDATTAALVEYLDAVSKRRLAAQLDEVKERKAAKKVREIERDYREALLQIRYHGEKRSGGTLHGLPGGQKWIRALEAYHLLNGEGLTDGKPDAAKMVELVLKDIHDQGVEASAWDVRQMESRMGNLIRPSQDEISKSLRDLHTQMLLVQQTEHMLKTGEMPPKTGFDRDEDSAAVRFLRRERERVMRKLGIDRKTADEMLKTALDSYKTRTRNQIEELERAIADVEAGKPYEKDERRKLQLDDEAQALKDRRDALKERLAALTHDPAKDEAKRVERAIAAVAKAIAVRREQIAAIEAGTYDFDAKRGEKASTPQLDQMRAELKALTKERDELKKALYPYGTEAEILRRLTLRDKTTQKSLDRWNGMAAEYQAAKSWEDRAKAVAPTERRKDIVDIESDSPEVKAWQEAIRAKQKLRDQARAKVAEFRNQLKREDTRGAGVSAWAKFLTSAPVMLRTMLDMSVGMVQGGRFMLAHPVKWAKVTFKASKAFLGQGWADELAKEIKDDPYFEDFKKHGGHLYNLEGLDSDTPEDFRALESGAPLPGGKTLSLENIPGVRRSARSFSGFLNKAGLELYRAMVESCGPDGAGATDNVKKDIARFVNTALGYGYSKTSDEKGLLRAIAGIADAMAWAPRKAVAEIKYATGYDLFFEPWLGTRKHEKSGAEIRQSMKAIGRQKLRHILGGMAFGLCLLLLAKAVNGDDDDEKNRMTDILDPRSPDFGRVRIGNTSYSVFGDEMVWRLIGRLVAGQTKVNGVVIEKNRQDILVQYARGKANPLLGLAWDLATGKDYTGGKVEDKSIGKLVRDYMIPLTWSAEYENFAMNDPLTAIVNAIPVFLGGAKSTYERDPLERVVKQGDEAKRRAKAAADAGDAATAQRIGEGLSERGEVYGAAKDVGRLQKKIKELEAKARTYKYTIDRSKDGGSPELQKDYADTVKAVEELQGQLEEARKAATETYRKAKGKGQKWDDMSWAE